MEVKRRRTDREGFKRRYRYRGVKPRAFTSRYDGDAYIKVEKTMPIFWEQANPVWNTQNYVSWCQARTDIPTSAGPNDFSYMDAPEYALYLNKYQFAEVRGIRVDVSAGQFNSSGNKALNSLEIFLGPAHDVPTGAQPAMDRLFGMPQRIQCNTQGQKTSAYLNVNKMIRNAGMPQSTQATIPYPTDYGYTAMVVAWGKGWSAADLCGNVTFTYYIRFHQRKYLA